MANPTDKTISLPFFSPIGGGVWGGAEQKIERKWFWSGGRRRDSGGDGAVEVLFARPERSRKIIARALLAPLFNSLLAFQKRFARRIKSHRQLKLRALKARRHGAPKAHKEAKGGAFAPQKHWER